MPGVQLRPSRLTWLRTKSRKWRRLDQSEADMAPAQPPIGCHVATRRCWTNQRSPTLSTPRGRPSPPWTWSALCPAAAPCDPPCSCSALTRTCPAEAVSGSSACLLSTCSCPPSPGRLPAPVRSGGYGNPYPPLRRIWKSISSAAHRILRCALYPPLCTVSSPPYSLPGRKYRISVCTIRSGFPDQGPESGPFQRKGPDFAQKGPDFALKVRISDCMQLCCMICSLN
jgi:hypothetical protein